MAALGLGFERAFGDGHDHDGPKKARAHWVDVGVEERNLSAWRPFVLH